MKVVLSWLHEFVDTQGIPMDDLVERWTLAGLEVESVETVGDWWDRERLMVCAVVRVMPHPNADRLVLADVDYGAGQVHRCVTGAPVLLGLREAGDLDTPLKVVFALEGVELYDGYADGWVKKALTGRPVRGVMSDAMVCSAKEIGLSAEHQDIMVLESDAPVGVPLVEYLGDTVVSMDLTPNLARALSVVGVARETAAIFGLAWHEPQPTVTTTAADESALVSIDIQDPDLCSRYVARIVRGVRIGPSPGRIARRLSLAGMRPISNIVDITNYVMLEWGEPLHAFDYDTLVERAGGERPTIVVRRAREGETIRTLDDVDRRLDTDMLLIADAAGPLAIAGVMGGVDTEVRPDTCNILLEAAAFDNISNRRTSRLLKLPSESASRFGRGVHPILADHGSVRAAALMRELAGGTVVGGAVDAYPRPPEPISVVLPPGEISRVLGDDLPLAAAVEILERLQFAVEELPDGGISATVPPHRMDVSLPCDLMEEIARIHGYDRLPSTLMADTLPPQRDVPDAALEQLVQNTLAASGLQEIVSYRLTSIDHEADLTPERSVDADAYVTLVNPISPERSAMRRSILTGLLDAARDNLRFVDRVACYEHGKVYHARADGLADEPRQVGILLTGPVGARGWRGEGRRAMDFHDAKGVVEVLLDTLGIAAEWHPGRHPSMHPARTAEVTVAGGPVGWVGELHPVVAERWDLTGQLVAVAALDVEALAQAGAASVAFAPFSSYPAVREDLAVVVDEAVPASQVASAIRDAGGRLLVDAALFDVYRGEQIGAKKKSLAWSLTFQASDATLTDDAAAAQRDKIVRSLQHRLGATIRS